MATAAGAGIGMEAGSKVTAAVTGTGTVAGVEAGVVGTGAAAEASTEPEADDRVSPTICSQLKTQN